MELTEITLYRFRNHEEFSSSLSSRVLVLGKNGSGKTALLEALYFAINATLPPKKNLVELTKDFNGAFFVRFRATNSTSPLEYEYVLSANSDKKSVSISIQEKSFTRPKYLQAVPLRAVLFSPDDVSVLYGSPSDRRDFLDEILSLSSTSFLHIKKEYQTALKNRNALLKRISAGEARSSDLDMWDILLSQKGEEYRKYRESIVDFFTQNIAFLSGFFHDKYELSLHYVSKTSRENTKDEMIQYLRKNRDRDILIGHTYIGPHLDDFVIEIQKGAGKVTSDVFLSRGENKSLFFALKLLSLQYLEDEGGKKPFLLLDDIFSELDREHRDMILESCKNRPFIITSQERPEILSDFINIQEIVM